MGRAYLRVGHTVYLGEGTATQLHAAHSVKIALALEGSFRVRVGSRPWATTRSIVVGSEVLHALEAGGAPIAVFRIQPEAFFAVGRGRRLLFGAVRPLGRALEESVRAPLRRHHESGGDPRELDELAVALVQGMRADAVVTRLDSRVARVIELFSTSKVPLRHAAIAAEVKLSPTRLTHLFREATGISLTNYHLWNRGRLAVTRVAEARSIAALAHQAGFADGAHLTRTSRRMLGVTPSEVLERCRFIGGDGPG